MPRSSSCDLPTNSRHRVRLLAWNHPLRTPVGSSPLHLNSPSINTGSPHRDRLAYTGVLSGTPAGPNSSTTMSFQQSSPIAMVHRSAFSSIISIGDNVSRNLFSIPSLSLHVHWRVLWAPTSQPIPYKILKLSHLWGNRASTESPGRRDALRQGPLHHCVCITTLSKAALAMCPPICTFNLSANGSHVSLFPGI